MKGCCGNYTNNAWVAARFPSGFPWGTFVVNVSGCFLLGLLLTVLSERATAAAPWGQGCWRLLLGVGFLGGYTTFSTLLYETWRLGPKGILWNLVGSGAAGYAAVALGVRIARLL